MPPKTRTAGARKPRRAGLRSTARRRLGRQLCGERGGLARALVADLAGGGPGDHGTRGVGDRHDRVVEGALDVSDAHGDVLLLLAPRLAGAGGAGLGRHLVPCPVGQSGGLLAGLLLAGHCALGALAGAGVGLGPLASHRKAAAVPDPLVASDLDLAADVRCDLRREVTLELVVALEEVTK